MNIVLLDAKTLGEDLDLSALENLGTFTRYETTSEEETLARIVDVDIVITNKVRITANMLAQTKKLKLICIAATGMNNVDLEAAKFQGVVVKNVAGYSTKSVVQHTFSMALYLLEKMAYYDKVVKDDTWSASGLFTDVSHPFYEISGKKWGIIGMGAIGREVATIATAFGAEVNYHSTSGENLHHAYPHKSLEFILKDCDIISIHAPLNDKTLDLINENNLPYLKDNAILLNLGRGGIINETDLAFELDRREIYAGLDVLEIEPITLTNRLNEVKHKERLLITPHIAWTSIEARKKLLEGIVKNINEFLESK
jgi:glycerate dehydrogenase